MSNQIGPRAPLHLQRMLPAMPELAEEDVLDALSVAAQTVFQATQEIPDDLAYTAQLLVDDEFEKTYQDLLRTSREAHEQATQSNATEVSRQSDTEVQDKEELSEQEKQILSKMNNKKYRDEHGRIKIKVIATEVNLGKRVVERLIFRGVLKGRLDANVKGDPNLDKLSERSRKIVEYANNEKYRDPDGKIKYAEIAKDLGLSRRLIHKKLNSTIQRFVDPDIRGAPRLNKSETSRKKTSKSKKKQPTQRSEPSVQDEQALERKNQIIALLSDKKFRDPHGRILQKEIADKVGASISEVRKEIDLGLMGGYVQRHLKGDPTLEKLSPMSLKILACANKKEFRIDGEVSASKIAKKLKITKDQVRKKLVGSLKDRIIKQLD